MKLDLKPENKVLAAASIIVSAVVVVLAHRGIIDATEASIVGGALTALGSMLGVK